MMLSREVHIYDLKNIKDRYQILYKSKASDCGIFFTQNEHKVSLASKIDLLVKLIQ